MIYQIAEIHGPDSRWAKSLYDYLGKYNCFYPEILTWTAKVLGELSTPKRSTWIATVGDRIVGVAITKNAEHAKLCHLSVAEGTRLKSIGKDLIRLSIYSALSAGARTVRFTAGDEVTEDSGDFFRRFGFHCVGWVPGRYRRGSDEHFWLATRESIFHASDKITLP